MPLAVNVSMLTKFKAEISGSVNCAPNKPKFVLTGEALTLMRLAPTVNCHHGMYSEITSTSNVKIPAASPNQLMFLHISCHLGGRGTQPASGTSSMCTWTPARLTFRFSKATLMSSSSGPE